MDVRLQTDPQTQKKICGHFLSLKKGEFKNKNLSIEDLLNNYSLFTEYICRNPPLGNGITKCRVHFSTKRHLVNKNNKYSKELKLATQEEMEKLELKHSNLVQELEILTTFISSHLEIALKEIDPDATTVQRRLVHKLKAASIVDDKKAIIQIVKDMEENLLDNTKIKEARRETEKLIETYSKIFKIEDERRFREKDYLHRSAVIQIFLKMFSYISQVIREPDDLARIRSGFTNIITGSFGNVSSVSRGEETPVLGYNNKDEGQDSSPV